MKIFNKWIVCLGLVLVTVFAGAGSVSARATVNREQMVFHDEIPYESGGVHYLIVFDDTARVLSVDNVNQTVTYKIESVSSLYNTDTNSLLNTTSSNTLSTTHTIQDSSSTQKYLNFTKTFAVDGTVHTVQYLIVLADGVNRVDQLWLDGVKI
jgi:hypothetical protein